ISTAGVTAGGGAAADGAGAAWLAAAGEVAGSVIRLPGSRSRRRPRGRRRCGGKPLPFGPLVLVGGTGRSGGTLRAPAGNGARRHSRRRRRRRAAGCRGSTPAAPAVRLSATGR